MCIAEARVLTFGILLLLLVNYLASWFTCWCSGVQKALPLQMKECKNRLGVELQLIIGLVRIELCLVLSC